eukprot:EG_transcript_9513
MSGSDANSMLAGSDDSFAFLCFGFVTSLLALAWLPAVLEFLWSMRSFDRFVENLRSFWLWLTAVPRFLIACVLQPGLLTTAAQTLTQRRAFAWRIATPFALRKTFRPKVVLLILFCVLLPIVLYQKLSFDPHEILQVSKDADEKTIKKQYRRLSMLYHPDKNRTEAARVQYTRVRRAYKMLADPQAFEEELASQGTGAAEVSVALPRFLLDPEYRRFAAPLLLGTLFLFPVGLIYMLAGSENDSALRQVIDHLIWLQGQYDYFYRMMGEPENTAGKPEDVIAQWKVDDTKYVVANEFVQLCNDNAASSLNSVFSLIRSNKHYIEHFKQYRALHQTKQEQLALLRAAALHGERPSKQVVTTLQAINKRLLLTAEALQPTESRLQNSELPLEDDVQGMVPPPGKKGARQRRP